MWLLLILSCVIWLIGSAYLILVLYYRLTRQEIFVPFVPADTKGIDAMCETLRMTGTEKVVDIGSGWGTILFHLHSKYPNLNLTGIELNPVLHLIAILHRFFFHRKSNMTLLKGDAAKVTYEKYDIIFLFMLSPFVNKVLVPKFEKELRKGTRVVSYVFRMQSPAFKERKISLPAHGWKSAVYVYEKM